MGRFLLNRLWQSVLVILGVYTIVFILIHLPGDPAAVLLPLEATPAEVAAFKARMGLDQPLILQYLGFLGRALHGDFGESLRHGGSALGVVLEHLPNTLTLAGFAFGLSIVLAMPLGLISGVKRGTIFDSISMTLALIGQCVPTFWLGIVLMIIFSIKLRMFPVSGYGSLKHLVLPGVTLAMYSMAMTTRLLRSSIMDVLRQDYVRTAKAKGLRDRVVLIKHVLRNAAIPVVTALGLRIGPLMAGAVITEQVFAFPGMGRVALQAISNRDVTVVQAFVVIVAIMILLVNLLVDIAYTLLDPRIRFD